MSRASDYVGDAMRACLPSGVPLSFSIDDAKWIRSGQQKRAVATVTMFDGRPAKLEVWSWSREGGNAHRWTDMPGGDVSFEHERWVRVVSQADLFGEAA